MKRKKRVAQGIGALVGIFLGSVLYMAAAESASITHTHSGSPVTGGGCYTTPVYHTHSTATCAYKTCGANLTYVGAGTGGMTGWYYWKCPTCGATSTTTMSPEAASQYGYKCSAITWLCGKNATTIDRYALSCTIAEGTVISTVTMQANTTAWAKQVTLSVSASGSAPSSYQWSDGSTGSSITVSSNGTYSCTVTVLDGTQEKTVSVDKSVSCIDASAPSLSLSRQDKTLSASASDAESGVVSYHWSDGSTGSSITVSSNGTYSCTVTDAAGNQTSQSIDVVLPVVAPAVTAPVVAPIIEEEPIVEEPIVEEKPVVEEEPIVEEKPVVEEEPIVEEKPVVEEEPVFVQDIPQLVSTSQPVVVQEPLEEPVDLELVTIEEEESPKSLVSLISAAVDVVKNPFLFVWLMMLSLIGSGIYIYYKTSYSQVLDGDGNKIGLVRITKKGDTYSTVLPASCTAQTSKCSIIPPAGFLKKASGKELRIKHDGYVDSSYVEASIDITL